MLSSSELHRVSGVGSRLGFGRGIGVLVTSGGFARVRCNGHYNRTPDLGKYVIWWNTWDLARYTILDAKVLDRNVTWLTKHKDTS